MALAHAISQQCSLHTLEIANDSPNDGSNNALTDLAGIAFAASLCRAASLTGTVSLLELTLHSRKITSPTAQALADLLYARSHLSKTSVRPLVLVLRLTPLRT